MRMRAGAFEQTLGHSQWVSTAQFTNMKVVDPIGSLHGFSCNKLSLRKR